LRGDNVDLPEPLGKRIESYFYAGKLLFIPVLKPILQADFVIVEHANKNVLNFPLALANRLGLKKVGYWGHGSNRQGDRNSTVETFKRMSLHWSDWWFAYTQSAAQYVATQGFDRSRITTVGNAVDTGRLTTKIQAVTELDRASMLTKLSLSAKGKRLIYCGSLYENKRLDLMLPTADALHSAMPDIQFIVIGGGPLAADVQEFAASRPWVRYVGPQFGMEKATLLTLANVWLNPGLVGLGILDAFCAGLPLVTTDLPLHSPEIEYLVHGYNGLMVSPSVAALTSEICKLFESPEQLAHLRHGALASAKEYSMESMVENFTQGILQWSK
jgi:glycosyltransferase involved in cell wall biosynthesis